MKNIAPPPRTVKAPAAVIAALLMLAGILFAPPSPAVAAPLPDHLVNGDFQYPTVPDDWWIYPWGGNGDVNKRFLTINPGKARAGQGCRLSANGHDLKGFDRARFGWASTQDSGSCPGGPGEPGNVELNRESGGNVYGEITADQERTTIYQDIAVTPGAMYTVSLRHASSNRGHVDSMHVLVGAPGRGQPIDMTRITSNGHGDKAGVTSKLIATKVDNIANEDKNGQWESYQGTWKCPAGLTVARFSFEAVSSQSWSSGNDVDDIIFTKAYPLAYNGNGNTSGTTPKQTK